jgi:anti-sigma factor RsiW
MNQTADQNSHSSLEQLYALVDRELDPGEHAIVAGHLAVCARCRSRYESLVRFDSACKRIPLERASPGFTRSVMASLGIVPKSPLMFRLLEHAAYLFGMVIVLAFMTAIFVLTGVIRTEDVAASSDLGGKALDTMGTGLSKASGVLSGWLTEFFPFGGSHGALSISAAVVVVVLALALVDKRITGRFAQRLR